LSSGSRKRCRRGKRKKRLVKLGWIVVMVLSDSDNTNNGDRDNGGDDDDTRDA